mgnify:FL=1|jgi:uncharacterized protein (DUF58 family)
MKILQGSFWQHLFFPQIGGRVRQQQRPLQQKWIPLGAWFYYCLYAWPTRRLAALIMLIILPAAGIFLLGIDLAAIRLIFALTATIFAAIVVGALMRPQVSLTATYPIRVERGEKFKIGYTLHNSSKRTLFDLSAGTIRHPSLIDVQLHSATTPTLIPNETQHLEAWGLATIRGYYRLPPLRYDSDFPSGLWRWGRTNWQERRLAVYPSYTRLVSLSIPAGARNRQDIDSARQITRSALEFHGCREYRAGDSLKHLHARSSARLGTPVIREFQAEGHGRTAVLIDTWERSSRLKLLPDRIVEASLSLAAAVTEHLASSDRTVELLVAGPEVHRFISAGKIGFLEDVLDILAAVEPTTHDTLPKLAPILIREIQQIESVCLILGRWDETRANFIKELTAHGIGIKAILVTNSPHKVAALPHHVIQLSCQSVRRGEVRAL